MSTITAAMVKELREATGAGMMDCKKALNETNGDMEAAVGFYGRAIAGGAAFPEVYRGQGLALLRSGALDEGRAALDRYLVAKPDAGDRLMIAMLAKGG